MAQLSEFQKFVLTQILAEMHEQGDFHLYDLIRNAIVHKDVSSFPEGLVLETYEAIDRFLTEHAFLREQKAKRLYDLTDKGKQLLILQNMDHITEILSGGSDGVGHSNTEVDNDGNLTRRAGKRRPGTGE